MGRDSISFSMMSFRLPYSLFELAIICSFRLYVGCVIGSVTALNGFDVAPSIISFRYIEYCGNEMMSSSVNGGCSSFTRYFASSAPTRNIIMVPTLPKIADAYFFIDLFDVLMSKKERQFIFSCFC